MWHSADPPMTVSQIIQNKWCIFRKTISASPVKNMVGGEGGQHLTRQG